MTRVIVSGDRAWKCDDLARKVIARLCARYGEVTIVHGGARGVDEAFGTAAAHAGCEVVRFNANWDEHGKAAGPIRNAEMIAAGADFVLAVHRFIRNSKGTKDCARQALAAGLPVWLIDSEDGEPKRLTKEMLG